MTKPQRKNPVSPIIPGNTALRQKLAGHFNFVPGHSVSDNARRIAWLSQKRHTNCRISDNGFVDYVWGKWRSVPGIARTNKFEYKQSLMNASNESVIYGRQKGDFYLSGSKATGGLPPNAVPIETSAVQEPVLVHPIAQASKALERDAAPITDVGRSNESSQSRSVLSNFALIESIFRKLKLPDWGLAPALVRKNRKLFYTVAGSVNDFIQHKFPNTEKNVVKKAEFNYKNPETASQAVLSGEAPPARAIPKLISAADKIRTGDKVPTAKTAFKSENMSSQIENQLQSRSRKSSRVSGVGTDFPVPDNRLFLNWKLSTRHLSEQQAMLFSRRQNISKPKNSVRWLGAQIQRDNLVPAAKTDDPAPGNQLDFNWYLSSRFNPERQERLFSQRRNINKTKRESNRIWEQIDASSMAGATVINPLLFFNQIEAFYLSRKQNPLITEKPVPESGRDNLEQIRNIKPDFPAEPVHIHTDSKAGAAAEALNAEAFTFGRHIFFAPGRFNLATSKGMALLGHELVHVKQGESSSADFKKMPMNPLQYEVREREALSTENRIFSILNNPERTYQSPPIEYAMPQPAANEPIPMKAEEGRNIGAELPDSGVAPEMNNQPGVTSPQIDVDQLARQVYSIIEQRLRDEKEIMGD